MNKTTTASFTTIIIVNAVFLSVLNVIFTFVGTILNSVVVMSLWNSQLRKKLCYFMILVLACFDLAVVVIVHPLIILEIIFQWVKNANVFRSIWNKYEVVYYLFVFSSNALFTMILERYLALAHPFFHKKMVTKSRLMTSFLLFQIPYGSLYILELHGLNPVFSHILFGVVFLTTCVLNFKLFYIATTLKQRATVTLGNFEGSNCEPKNCETKKFKVSLANSRTISTCFLAVICLFLCYLPFIVSSAVEMTVTDGLEQNKRFIISFWAKTFLTLNSSLNCLIFFYKNSVLRRHGEKFLKKCFRRRLGLHV